MKEKAPEVPFVPLASLIREISHEIQTGKENQPDFSQSPNNEVPAKTSGEEEKAL